MRRLFRLYDRLVVLLGSRPVEGAALLVTRIALAGVFWRSGRSKIAEGSWFQISDATYYLFETDYSGVPLPADLAAPMAAFAEHLFPALLVLGLATRFSALSLLAMTMVIQVFVFPDAWWTTHILWVALAAVLIVRGGGMFSLDDVLAGRGKT